jgi:small conductance mechanosensitive channel
MFMGMLAAVCVFAGAAAGQEQAIGDGAAAALYKKTLSQIEEKERANEQSIAAQYQSVADIKENLDDLRRRMTTTEGVGGKLGRAAVILLLGTLFYFGMSFGFRKANQFISRENVLREDERVLRIKTLMALFRWIGSILIIALTLFLLLELFGFNMAPILAGAGIVGLAFGFGGQYLIRDIINGVFILVEGQYRINDVVKIGEHGGLVEAVNLRVTRLRDLEGKVIYIPNGEIKSVVNFTQEFSQALLNIGVAYKENVDRVMEVIKEVGAAMQADPHFSRMILDELEMLGVDDFAASQVTIKCRIKTLPIKQWEVAREFRRRIKNRFDELGIEIPFPHTTLYFGTGKDNDWVREWAKRS